MKKIYTRDFNNGGNKITCTVDVKDGKDITSSEVIEFRSVEEMNSRLANIKKNTNHIAEIFPALVAGEWTEPVKPEKTEEQLEKEKENQIREELYKAKEDFGIGLMTEAEYLSKVTAVKTKEVKSKLEIKK